MSVTGGTTVQKVPLAFVVYALKYEYIFIDIYIDSNLSYTELSE